MPECNLSIICITHGPLISVKEHSNNLVRFLNHASPYQDEIISSWFRISSGLNKVDYYSGAFEDSALWCRPAYEYEEAKSEFHSRLILSLTKFTYIWGGLEALLNKLNLPDCPKHKGKINALSFFLKTNFDSSFTPVKHYQEVVSFLKSQLTKMPWYGTTNELFKLKSCNGVSSEGLSVVYKIRNKFAHGAFIFDEPAEYRTGKNFDIEIIAASCRIILLTIQMILLVVHKNDNFGIYNESEEDEDNEQEYIDQKLFLKIMHLKK